MAKCAAKRRAQKASLNFLGPSPVALTRAAKLELEVLSAGDAVAVVGVALAEGTASPFTMIGVCNVDLNIRGLCLFTCLLEGERM